MSGTDSAARAPKKSEEAYHIVLFYKYANVPDANALGQFVQGICEELELLGRVIVASEGINGNLASKGPDGVANFCKRLQGIVCFAAAKGPIDFKMDSSVQQPFPDLFVQVKKEICSTGHTIPKELLDKGLGGKHLSPKEFHEVLSSYWEIEHGQRVKKQKPLVVIDVRNNVEFHTGRFMGKAPDKGQEAVNPETKTFSRWAPDYANKAAGELKDKKVLMYCTGGIRCEKASAYLKSIGVDDVSQLQGGIHRYLEQYGSDGYFQGSNFVFDSRALQKPAGAKVIGKCHDADCAAETEALSCDRACAVCREPVLVCDACRVKLYGVYFCKTHADLKGVYEPFLERFPIQELQTQRSALVALQKSGCKPATKQIKRIDVWLARKSQQQKLIDQQVAKESQQQQQQQDNSSENGSPNDKGKMGPRLSVFGRNPRCRQCGMVGPEQVLSLMKRQFSDKTLCCDGKCTGFTRTEYENPKRSLDFLNSPEFLASLKGTGRASKKRKKRNERDITKRRRHDTEEEYSHVKYEVVQGSNGEKLRRVAPYMYEFKAYVKERWHKRTLLDMYCDEFSGNKRAYHAAAVKYGLTTVGGLARDQNFVLHQGDFVSNCVHRHEPDIAYVAAKDMIVSETKDLVVVNKPASVTIHPSGAFRRNSLTFIFAVELGLASLYPIHRLDRHTSGLVLFAKNAERATLLCDAMRRKGDGSAGAADTKIRKVYIARVEGKFPCDAAQLAALNLTKRLDPKAEEEVGQVHCPEESGYLKSIALRATGAYWDPDCNAMLPVDHAKSSLGGHVVMSWPMRCVNMRTGTWECVTSKSNAADVKAARASKDSDKDIGHQDQKDQKFSMSRIRLLEYNSKNNTSIIQCEPVTGRTHQLRVHLAFMGFPICNDPLYGSDGDPQAGYTVRDHESLNLENTTKHGSGILPESSELQALQNSGDKEALAKSLCYHCVEGTDEAFTPVQRRIKGIDLHAYRYKVQLPDSTVLDFQTTLPPFAT